MTLVPLTCVKCGAPLNTMKCDYCSTKYIDDNKKTIIFDDKQAKLEELKRQINLVKERVEAVKAQRLASRASTN